MDKLNRKRNLLQKIKTASDAIRYKYKLLKRGQNIQQKAVNDLLKPIVSPLNQLLGRENARKRAEEIKKNENKEKEEEEGEEVEINVENEPQQTLAKLLNKIKNRKSSDPVGVRFSQEKYKIGDTEIKFNGNTFQIADKTYNLTPGLLQVLFEKNPKNLELTAEDEENYINIIHSTHAERARYNAEADIRKTGIEKYNKVATKVKGSGLLPEQMVARRNPAKMDYIYWDDPNELVDRLRLLLASQSAGNNNHNNEIVSIIEELREANIIY